MISAGSEGEEGVIIQRGLFGHVAVDLPPPDEKIARFSLDRKGGEHRSKKYAFKYLES